VDTRDVSILTQVAFKEAGEQSRHLGLNLFDQDGQAQWEQLFSYVTESLFLAVRSQIDSEGANKAGELVRAAFPGSTAVAQMPQDAPQAQGWQQPPQQATGGAVGPHNYQLTVRGTQYGDLPPWLYEMAAKDNVHEVYDNRDQPPGSRRPMFKSTIPGRDAPAYWAPGR
jgi:hypothetical protein